MSCPVNHNALKSEVRSALINAKSNACPMAIRVAWHAAGTYDAKDGSGGSNGGTMRFEPESTDPANAGLSIIRDMLHLVQKNHPEISTGDLWTFAGAQAVEFLGGPKINHEICREDKKDGSACPPNGRLPDASQGAEHLREVFGRMGFGDREIVALSGAHTLGRCHLVRSGFDGPWTEDPLKFDNTYFKNLMYKEWRPRKWDGNFQYEDVETGRLMMLPTDMALKTDAKFRVYAQLYADDEPAFFKDFADAFAKLLALGTKPAPKTELTEKEKASAEFREAAMHGSFEAMTKWAAQADVHSKEPSSGRTALHKAAFWGHIGSVKYLVEELKLDVNATDYNGDTALHDAVRFGHTEVVDILVKAGTDLSIKNKEGKTPKEVARQYDKPDLLSRL